MNPENCDSLNALRISNDEDDGTGLLNMNTNSSSPLILKRSSVIDYDDNIPYVDSHSIETAKESPKIKIATNHDFDNLSDIGIKKFKGGSVSSLRVSALQTEWPSSDYVKSTKLRTRTHSNCDRNRVRRDQQNSRHETNTERQNSNDSDFKKISFENLSENQIVDYLSKNDPENQATAKSIMRNFGFYNSSLHEALYSFTGKIPIIGESQERERILTHFTDRYIECNPGRYKSFDACHTLVCALMLLNTDLHSQISRKKMSCDDFISNLNDNYPQYEYNKEELTLMYNFIKKKEFKLEKISRNKSTMATLSRKVSKFFTKPLSVSNSTPKISLDASILNRKTFISGNIVRRCVSRPFGRKPSIGHRGWKLQYATVIGLHMLLFKTNLNSSGGGGGGGGNGGSVVGTGSDFYQQSMASGVSVSMETEDAGCFGDDRMSVTESVVSSELMYNGSSNMMGQNRHSSEFAKQAARFNSTSSIASNSTRDSPFIGHTDSRLSAGTSSRFFGSTSNGGSGGVVPGGAGSRDSLATPYSSQEINPNDLSESVMLHHCFAKIPDKHRNNPKNVFSLHLSDMSVYHFKVNLKCLHQWINTINYAAALLSAPPIVGAGHTDVYKPLMPRHETDQDRNGQIESFQVQISNYSASLDRLQKSEVNLSPNSVQNSIQFCKYEIHRFETYIELLRQTDPSTVTCTGAASTSTTSNNRDSPTCILAHANRIFGDNNSNIGTCSNSLGNSESSLTMVDYPIQQQQQQPINHHQNQSEALTLRKRPPQHPSSNQIARKLFHTPSPTGSSTSQSNSKNSEPQKIVRQRSGSATRSRSVNINNHSNLIAGCYGNRPNRCFSSTHHNQYNINSNSTYSPSFSRFIDPNPVSMVTTQQLPLSLTNDFTTLPSPKTTTYHPQQLQQSVISPINSHMNSNYSSSRTQSPLTTQYRNADNSMTYCLPKPTSFNYLPRYSPPNSAAPMAPTTTSPATPLFNQPPHPLTTSTPFSFHVNSHQYHQHLINSVHQHHPSHPHDANPS